MMILDAVNSAPTGAAVYFLVTAYLESLRHFQRACGVPERALDLPITSRTDLSRRLSALELGFSVPSATAVAVSELAAVIRCALTRLEKTGDSEVAQCAEPLMYCATSDNPRSSPSV